MLEGTLPQEKGTAQGSEELPKGGHGWAKLTKCHCDQDLLPNMQTQLTRLAGPVLLCPVVPNEAAMAKRLLKFGISMTDIVGHNS